MTPKQGPPHLNVVAAHHQPQAPAFVERLVLSIAEAAEALGVSDDLVYELTERGIFPVFVWAGARSSPVAPSNSWLTPPSGDFDPAITLTSVDRAKRERTDPATLAEASATPR